jgi:hypothetical protein
MCFEGRGDIIFRGHHSKLTVVYFEPFLHKSATEIQHNLASFILDSNVVSSSTTHRGRAEDNNNDQSGKRRKNLYNDHVGWHEGSTQKHRKITPTRTLEQSPDLPRDLERSMAWKPESTSAQYLVKLASGDGASAQHCS